MSDNVLEFWIKAKDATTDVLNATLAKVRNFSSSVQESLSGVKSSLGGDAISERFVHTQEVLDEMGKRFDALGIDGEVFSRAMDYLQGVLDNFNKSGGSATTMCYHFIQGLQAAGMSLAESGSALEFLEANITDAGKGASKLGILFNSAMDKMKRTASSFAGVFQAAKAKMGVGDLEEKYIHTGAVLHSLGNAFRHLGVDGEDSARMLAEMKARLDEFNRTGGDAKGLIDSVRKVMAESGATATQVSQGVDMLKRNMTDAGQSGTVAAKTIRGDLRGVHIMMGALNGDTYSLARAFTFLLGHIKKLGMSAAALSGITIAIYAISEVISKCVGWWKEKRDKMKEIQDLKFENTLKDYSREQEKVNKELEREEGVIDRQLNRKKKLIEHNRKLIEQQIEMNRLAALEGKTGEEREAINKEFDAQQADLKARTQIQLAQEEIAAGAARDVVIAKAQERLKKPREELGEQLKKLEAEVEKREKEKRDMLGKAQTLDYMTVGGQGGGVSAKYRNLTQSEIEDRFDEWRVTDKEYVEQVEKRDRLKKQVESLDDDLAALEEKRQDIIDEAEDNQRKIQETETDRMLDDWKDREEDMNSYYEELSRRQEQEMRAAEQNLARQLMMEQRLHEQKVKDAEDELRASQSAESAAEGRLQAAAAKVNTAWGWYKDKSSMQKAIDEYNGQKEAEKQWAKDFEKLKTRRRDWRDVEFGQLSAEDEAVRQVALAKEEEKQAAKDLAEIRENTAYLAEILDELKGEGEEA